MRLENKSKRNYVHSVMNAKMQVELIILRPGENKEIPDEVAKSWIKSDEVVEYVDPKQAKAEKSALEDENKKLKAEIEELKAQKPANTDKPKTKTQSKTKAKNK